MNLLDFIRKEAVTSPTPLIRMAVLGGLVNGALLAAFSKISSADKSGPDLDAVLLILSTMIIYYYTKQYTLLASLRIMEEMINSIRKRLVGKLRHAELLSFEMLDNAKLYSLLTQEVNTLSQSVSAIVYAFQSSVIVLFCLIFIGINSVPTLLTMLFAFLLGALTYFKIKSEADRATQKAVASEASFFTALEQILGGFKEIKMHARKNKAVFHAYATITRKLKQFNLQAGTLFSLNFVFTQSYFYALIGIIVFILPAYSSIESSVITSVTIATLFMISPLMMVISSIPQFTRANISINNLYEMEETLTSIEKDVTRKETKAHFRNFNTITLERLSFSYPRTSREEEPYSVEEISLTLKRGELLFIAGGNGSGKTTLLKLITGLYRPDSGCIKVDKQVISLSNLHAYRELFSGIFADYHLFDKLYGIDETSDEQVNELIARMELEEKTAYREGRFTNLQLSQGQRKRLGLIVALLEEKPICIFDEWAADQDPHFKKFFYEELLQDLRKQGKTIIVISHDDRYYDVADRILMMEYGRITKERRPRKRNR